MFGSYEKIRIFAAKSMLSGVIFSLSMSGRGPKLILWNETSGQLYGQSRKDVFERYCLDTQTSQL